MILYLDKTEVPNLEDIPSNVLWYLIRKAEGANGRFLRLDRYYRGQHDNLRKRAEPDEIQVAVNYAKYVVDIAQGYYLGEPVKYDANETHEAENSPQGGKTGLAISQHPEDGNSHQSGAQTAELAVKEGQHIDLSPLLAAYDRQHISEVDSPPKKQNRSPAKRVRF